MTLCLVVWSLVVVVVLDLPMIKLLAWVEKKEEMVVELFVYSDQLLLLLEKFVLLAELEILGLFFMMEEEEGELVVQY